MLEGKIHVGQVLERLLTYVIGTPAGKLIAIGMTFFSISLFDVAIFYIEGVQMNKDISAPGDVMKWNHYAGFLFIALGFGIYLYKYMLESKKENEERLLSFLLNYKELNNTELQAQFKALFNVECSNVSALRIVLDDQENQRGAVRLYRWCHLNVEPHNDWLILKGKFLTIRYFIGNVVLFLSIMLVLTTLFFCVLEFIQPGITNSGEYALRIYMASIFAMFIGCYVLMDELKKFGTAFTLVKKKYK
ncbi:hypothetical protein ACRTEP_23375 [Vibrio diabolicus]|uniref:hypothetical protein n=1 Tax=Vibrio diabolicus TaxID=50719 RepID=UPI003D7DA5D3